MIVLRTAKEIDMMRKACQISAEALQLAGEAVKPGITTYEIDQIAYRYIKKQGAEPNFLNYNGFPATACISINDEVIHGIPSKKRVLMEGDIVSIDLGAKVNGYNGDNAATFACGIISDEAKRLCDTTRESLYLGIEQAVAGNRIGDIAFAIQSYCEERGFSVVREYTGHGVGTHLHEDPSVPNYGTAGRGQRLLPGTHKACRSCQFDPDVLRSTVLGPAWSMLYRSCGYTPNKLWSKAKSASLISKML